MVFLPENEDILSDDCGDRDSWNIVASHHVLSVAPKVAGAESNLNVITKAGSVYSFTLKEGGKGVIADLKVFVTVPEDTKPLVRKFYTVAEYEAGLGQVADLKQRINDLQTALDTARQEADAKAEAANAIAPTRFHFDHKLPKDAPPFRVKAIFHDGHFTYVQSGAREKFAIYEVMGDGKANALNAQVENGVYIIPKVVGPIELALGAERLKVALKEGAGN